MSSNLTSEKLLDVGNYFFKSIVKSIRRKIGKILLSIHAILFLNTKGHDFTKQLTNCGNTPSLFDIVTICFNEDRFIKIQVQLLKKYIQDPFTHILADNSTDKIKSERIKEIAKECQVGYIKIPSHHFKRNHSHAAAMHWVYKNVIRPRGRKFFGFIDHDIFPTAPIVLADKMEHGVYGRPTPVYAKSGGVKERTKEYPYWSLWAGLLFIENSLLKDTSIYKITFAPKVIGDGDFLDTGGGLWDSVYKNIPYPKKDFRFESVKFRATAGDRVQTDHYERHDEWLHLVNLSNWVETPEMEEKLTYFKELLAEKTGEDFSQLV